MKRYINSLFVMLLAAVTFSACTEDDGTDPGSDSGANLVVYEYSAAVPNNPDNDAVYRVAMNNRTSELYYLAEPTETADANGKATPAYADRVIANGTKVTIDQDAYSGGNIADVVVSGMKGDYTITFVAVNGNQKVMKQSTFFGLEWIDVASGTYKFSEIPQKVFGLPASSPTTIQYCKSEPNLYRFKDLYGTTNHLKFKKTDVTGSDENGTFCFIRVEGQSTPFSFSSYGTVSVRDLAYWQNDESLAYDPGLGSYMYIDGAAKNSVVLALQFYVDAGNLGYKGEMFVAK
ncbi:MAG: hypothetical protein ACOYJK_10795 [Prevotella sp.]|jgi:hypothetical protein